MDNELEQQLDALVRGDSDPPAFIEMLCTACSATPDLAWDVLAITDQYRRRGKISAELSRTIRTAIERPAVARQVPELADAMANATMEPISPPAPCAWTRHPATNAPPMESVLQDEMRALRNELDAARRTGQRYRVRLAKLAAFGRSQRDALANIRRDLEVALAPAPAPLAGGLYAALDLPPYETNAARAVDEQPRVRKSWISPSQAAASIVLLLTVTASPALRETPIDPVVLPNTISAVSVASPTPAVAASQLPQTLSLGSEQYVVAPSGRQAQVRVQRSGGSSGGVSFTWWTSPSGAKSGVDYRGRRPTVARLPEGVDAMTISIPIIANPLRAHTELFFVEIGHPTGGAAIGAIGRSAIIIVPSHRSARPGS